MYWTRVTFKLKVRPPFSNASKTLISDGETTSGSGAATNHKKHGQKQSQKSV